MEFEFNTRASDSPFVEWIYSTQSAHTGTFMSEASRQWEMVVTKTQGVTTLSMRGPETRAQIADVPADAEFLGIAFKPGTFMPDMPMLADAETHLPEAMGYTFFLHGTYWEFPTFENADDFVNRLVQRGLLVEEPLVSEVLEGKRQDLSLRSVQRRFLRATGMPYGVYSQIERAQEAAALLQQGVSILDTVEQAGYADQPHLTRSLKRFMGQTPAQIARGGNGSS